MSNPYDRRRQALELAIELHGEAASADRVVRTAATFENYIYNGSPEDKK